MKTTLMVLTVVLVFAVLATPAFCGKPGDTPAKGSLDGALSERWFAYGNTDDVIKICISEMIAQGLIDEKGYGKELEGTHAVDPVFVESLDKDYPSYYMVSFADFKKINVLCIMAVKDGKTMLSEVYGLNPEITTAVYPPIIESEAKNIAKAQGKAVGQSKAKLVFKFSKECGGPAMPAWDLGGGVKVSQVGEVFSDFTPESKIKPDK